MVANYCAIKSNFAHGVMGMLFGNSAGTFPLATGSSDLSVIRKTDCLHCMKEG